MKEYLFDDDVTAQWLGRELFAPREKTVTVALEGLQPYRLYVIIVISNWRVLWYSNVLRVNVCHLLYRTNHYLSAKQSVNMQGHQVAFNKINSALFIAMHF